jgi:hypothetical protein
MRLLSRGRAASPDVPTIAARSRQTLGNLSSVWMCRQVFQACPPRRVDAITGGSTSADHGDRR